MDNWCRTGNRGLLCPLRQDTPNPVPFLWLTKGGSGPCGQDRALQSPGSSAKVPNASHPMTDKGGRTLEVNTNSTRILTPREGTTPVTKRAGHEHEAQQEGGPHALSS